MSEQDTGGPAKDAVFRIASACWASESSHMAWIANRIADNDRRALYWRASSVVCYDRVMRAVDADWNRRAAHEWMA